jgi:putative nucleotidyltransferase with HDIG domain
MMRLERGRVTTPGRGPTDTPVHDAKTRRILQAFVFVLAAAGLLVIARAIESLPNVQFDYRLPLLTLLVMASARFSIKVPGRAASVGVSEVFVFATMFLFGTAPATLIVALDGIGLALVRREQPIYRALFNIVEPAVSTWMAGTVFFAVSAVPQDAVVIRILTWQAAIVAATATYFLLDSALTSLVLALEGGDSAYSVWRQHAPILAVNYYAAGSLAALGRSGGPNLTLAVIGLVVPLLVLSYVAYREAATRVEAARQHVEDLEQLYKATVETLATAVDAKDQVTHGHIRRVQRHSLALAKALGVTDEREIKALEAAALLHDVGKLCVPDHVLNKPGALKAGEFHAMKLHATQGATILSTVQFPYPVVPIVKHHHEAWNGRGYPDGLAGEEIPFGARILAVVDCFDALTSDRPYRRKLHDDQALRMIAERSGTAYDPRVVERFIAIVPELRRQDRLLEEASQRIESLVTEATLAAHSGIVGPSLTSTVDTVRFTGSGATISAVRIAGATVLPKVQQLLPGAEACLFAVGPTGDVLIPAAATPLAQVACENAAFPIGSGLSGWVAAHRHTIVNSDPSLDFGDRAAQLGFQSATATPVFAFATVAAVLTVYLPQRGMFTDRVVRAIGTLAQEVGMEFVQREHSREERPVARIAQVRVAG